MQAHVHSGGLYRCCLLHMEELVAEGKAVGPKTACRYCGAWIELGTDNVWRWAGANRCGNCGADLSNHPTAASAHRCPA